MIKPSPVCLFFFFSKVRKMVHSVGYNFFFFNPSFLFQNNLLFQST